MTFRTIVVYYFSWFPSSVSSPRAGSKYLLESYAVTWRVYAQQADIYSIGRVICRYIWNEPDENFRYHRAQSSNRHILFVLLLKAMCATIPECRPSIEECHLCKQYSPKITTSSHTGLVYEAYGRLQGNMESKQPTSKPLNQHIHILHAWHLNQMKTVTHEAKHNLGKHDLSSLWYVFLFFLS